MSGESWDEVLEKARSKAPARVMPLHPAEGDALLPGWDSPYKAAAHPDHHALVRFVCIMGKDSYRPGGTPWRFFQYVHKDSNTGLSLGDQGHVMTLRFIGSAPTKIIVKGPNLLRICDYIHLHRIAWIRVCDPERDFVFLEEARGKKTEIITSIKIIDGE